MEAGGRVVVVANPTAGRGKGGKLIGKVDRMLREAGVPNEIRISKSGEDVTNLAREAAEQGAAIVAALGGDGTIGNAANGLLGSGAALATLPSGTADDFAKSIGMGKLGTAARQLASPRIEQVDVVKVTTGASQRHFVNVAGAGFDSEVNETANAMRLNLGSTGTYVAAVLKTLSKFQPASFRIEIDDDTWELGAMLVVVGNGISYGGGMRVTPDASIVDGVLDLCVVEAIGKGAFLRAFPKVFRGTHTSHPNVRTARGKRIKIEADRRVQVYADGERVGPLPAIFDVLPGALPLVIGPGARAVR